jgi:hypothetical protein
MATVPTLIACTAFLQEDMGDFPLQVVVFSVRIISSAHYHRTIFGCINSFLHLFFIFGVLCYILWAGMVYLAHLSYEPNKAKGNLLIIM